MKKVIASASLLALGAVGVTTAQAEWAAGADKPYVISGTLRGFYDDNYNTQPNGANRVGSFGFEVRPHAEVVYANGPTALKASYTYSLRYFDDRRANKIDQSHDFEFSLNHAFNERYAIDFEESFLDAQEPTVLDRFNSAVVRATDDNIRNSAAVNFSGQITRQLGFVIGYANTYYDYTGNVPNQIAGSPSYASLLNRFEHVVTLNGRWMLSEQTTGILGYQFGAVDYYGGGSITSVGSVLGFVPSKTRDNYTHTITLGIEHAFRSDLTFSGRAGVQVSDYYNALPNDNSGSVGPFADLSLNYQYRQDGSVTFGFRQAKNQTDVGDPTNTGRVTQDQESSTIYGQINQTLTPLSPKLVASVSGQYQNSVFNGGGFNNRSDTFYLLGLNLSYQFTRYLSSEVGYNYDLLQSGIPGRGYDRNRVYIGVTASY